MAYDFCFPSHKHGRKRLLSRAADPTAPFKFTNPFKGDHLSAGLVLRMGKLSTCLRSQVLKRMDHTSHCMSSTYCKCFCLFKSISIGHPGRAKTSSFSVLVKASWAHHPLGSRKPNLALKCSKYGHKPLKEGPSDRQLQATQIKVVVRQIWDKYERERNQASNP